MDTHEKINSVVSEFIKNLGAFIHSYPLYPRDNEHMVTILDKLNDVLQVCFNWRTPISLTVMQEQLYFEELVIQSRHPVVEQLIDNMLDRLIRKIVLQKNYTNDDLFSLVQVLNMDPIELRDKGGPRIVFEEDLNIKNISLFEIANLFDEDDQKSDSWKRIVHRAGLNVEEVANFMRGPDAAVFVVDRDSDDLLPPKGRLMQGETAKLIELLNNPEVLLEMLLDLASVSTDQGPMVDPLEFLRIVTRTENTLLFQSDHTENTARERIVEALKMLDQNVRTAILFECLSLRKQGMCAPGMELFMFSGDEWAAVIADIVSNQDFVQSQCPAVFSKEDWANIESRLPYVKTMDSSVNLAFQRFLLPEQEKVSDKNHTEKMVRWARTQFKKSADNTAFTFYQNRLKDQIQTGYTDTILGLLLHETDEQRIQEIFNNFFEQVEQIRDSRLEESLEFLTSMQEVLKKKGDRYTLLFKRWITKNGIEFFARAVKQVSDLRVDDNRKLFVLLIPWIDQAGMQAVKQTLDLSYYNAQFPDPVFIAESFAPFRKKLIWILDEYLNEGSDEFSLDRFILSLDLHLTAMPEKSEALVNRLLESEHSSIHTALFLRLLRYGPRDIGIRIFRDALWGKSPVFTEDQKIIAAYGLGALDDKDSKDKLHKLAKIPMFVTSLEDFQVELRAAALYSFAKLSGEKGKKVIRKLVKKILQAKRNPTMGGTKQ